MNGIKIFVNFLVFSFAFIFMIMRKPSIHAALRYLKIFLIFS